MANPVSLPGGDFDPLLIHVSVGTQVHTANSMLISSAIFAALTVMTNRQKTDQPCYFKLSSRPNEH